MRLALHASSGMAQMCLCKQFFTEAEDWCKKTRIGLRHVVGKQYQLYITCVRLIAFAYELKGDVANAAAFNDIADEAQLGSIRVPKRIFRWASQQSNPEIRSPNTIRQLQIQRKCITYPRNHSPI